MQEQNHLRASEHQFQQLLLHCYVVLENQHNSYGIKAICVHLDFSLDDLRTLGEVSFEVFLALVPLPAPLADKLTFLCMH